MPLRTRVELTDLAKPDDLRPAQQNIDTYVRPEQAPIDDNAKRLGEALSGFGLAIARLGHTKPKDDPRVAEAYHYMSSATDDKLIGGYANGQVPYANVPHIRGLYETEIGQRAARLAVDDVRLGVQDGTVPLIDNDGKPIDIQQLVAQRGEKYSGNFRTSVPFQKAFYGGIESQRNSLIELQRGQVADYNKGVNTTLVKSSIEDVVKGASEGLDDDQLRAAIQKRTAAAKTVVGMNPRDIDPLYIGRIRELATQNPDAAERLLKLDRGKGFDGQPLGSLADNPTYRKEVGEIALAINSEREKRFDVSRKNAAATDARARLDRADGSFATITDDTYTNPFAARDPSKVATRTISASEVKDQALNTFLKDSDAALVRQGANPMSPDTAQTKFRREYEVFVNANRPHPVWQQTLATTGRVLSNPTSLSDPREAAKVEAAGKLYQTLAARNYAYTTETLGVPERERKFYDQMDVYSKLGDPPQEAARKAAAYITKPPPPLTGDELKKLKSQADGLDLNGWSAGGSSNSWIGEGWNNQSVVRTKIFETAKAIAADRGVPVDKVINIAADKVKERTVMFNGQAIPFSAYLTNETKPFYEKRIEELYKPNERVLKSMGITSPKDMSLHEEAPGVFRVIGKDGQNVLIPKMEGNQVTGYSTLYVHDRDIAAIRAQAREKAVEDSLAASRDAADKAIVNAPYSYPGKTFKLGPSKEERKAAADRLKSRHPDPVPDFSLPQP